MTEKLWFRLECSRTWDSLTVTGDDRVRHCDDCKRDVHLSNGVLQALADARAQRCVAVPSELVAMRRRATEPMPATVPTRTLTLGNLGDDGFPVVGWLVPLDGAHRHVTYPLRDGIATIGNAHGATIQLDDELIEPVHCHVRNTPQGFELCDAGSTIGTVVNDKRTTRCELVDGDVIVLGATRLAFKTIV